MNLVATHYYCTSPMDYISHHALHSHIPIHHYTNHTAVTIHSLALIVSPHLHLIHTHTHLSSILTCTHREVLFLPRLTFLSVFPVFCYPVFDPDCPTLELWTCACDLDPCLVLFTSLLCLWYSCCCPLTIACLILPLSNKSYCKWIHSPQTSHYRRLRQLRSSSVISTTQPTMDCIGQLLHLCQGGLTMEEYVHQFCELSYQVPLYDESLFKDLFYFGLNSHIKAMFNKSLFSGGVYNGSLRGLMDYALLYAGSSFTVGVAEEEGDTMPLTKMATTPADPPLVSVQAAGIPRSAALAAPSGELAESAPEPAPSRELAESAPEPAPSRELAESAPEPAPSRELAESAPEPAPSRSSQSPLQSPLRPGSSQSPLQSPLRPGSSQRSAP